MSTFKQDMPPPGGYADINYGSQVPFKYIKGSLFYINNTEFLFLTLNFIYKL